MAGLRILQLLCQRPSLTGSGMTLDALSRELEDLDQRVDVVVGVPADDPTPRIADLAAERIHPLRFGEGGDLPFPVPGMSDVMPYRSTVFASMDDARWNAYRDAWRDHLARVVEEVRPDVIHAHHVWLLAALVKDVAPDVPLVVHCHATGLRQLALCPERAPEVLAGVRRADAFVTLHDEHTERLVELLDVPRARVHRIGAGFDEKAFHARGRAPEPETVTFVGKLSLAKGVQPLLDAFGLLVEKRPGARLAVAGIGSGPESDALQAQIDAAPWATQLGRLTPEQLAAHHRRSAVFALPSFYEGLPLVLAEAAACGCRLVATALPGIESLAPDLGDTLALVELPRLVGIDQPDPDDLPAFTRRLAAALERALDQPPADASPERLAPFTWRAVTHRLEAVYRGLARSAANGSDPGTPSDTLPPAAPPSESPP